MKANIVEVAANTQILKNALVLCSDLGSQNLVRDFEF